MVVTLTRKVRFNERCKVVDFENTSVTFENTITGNHQKIKSDFIIGSDGAFSEVRKQMIKKYNHQYSYNEIDHDYKELLIPSGPNESYLIEKNALHIWPRGEFMLMALANLDGSFTCTLFAPKKGKNSFENLNTKSEVEKYFSNIFPDFYDLVPDLYNQWQQNPTSSLGIVRTYPWHIKDSAILIGDSAHATVPFYGQGMNASFEDVVVLDSFLDQHDGNWQKTFKAFEHQRKKDTDGIADLAIDNFHEMKNMNAQ